MADGDDSASMHLIALLAVIIAQTAHAHETDEARAPGLELWLVCVLLLSIALYALGVCNLWRAAGGKRGVTPIHAFSFAAGWTVLAVALTPPLDPMGAKLFSAHMLQHELLMLVAAPLLVLGRPLAAWTWALPIQWRHGVAPVTHSLWIALPWAALTHPVSAWGLHALAIWLWHLPVLFTAALTHDGIHARSISVF